MEATAATTDSKPSRFTIPHAIFLGSIVIGMAMAIIWAPQMAPYQFADGPMGVTKWRLNTASGNAELCLREQDTEGRFHFDCQYKFPAGAFSK